MNRLFVALVGAGVAVAIHGLVVSTGPVFFVGFAVAVAGWLGVDCARAVRR